MRILSVSVSLPYPPDHATRLRTWNLLWRLAASDDVVALTWLGVEDTAAAAAACSKWIPQLLPLPCLTVPGGRIAGMRRRLVALAGGPPPWIQHAAEARGLRLDRALHATPNVRGGTTETAFRSLVEQHRRQPFDVVVAETDGALTCLPPIDAPVALHRHNLFTPTLAALQSGASRWWWPVYAPVWRRFDRRCRAPLLIATTEPSAEALREMMPDTAVVVVANGTDAVTEIPPAGEGRHVGLVACWDYAPNIQGAQWLVVRVWPAVQSAVPSAELVVIGRSAPQSLCAPGVRLAGYAPDLAQALADVRVGVAPVWAGMGIKTKTLTLLAHGRPVVTTPHGAEGIPEDADGGLVVAADASAFAAAVERLLAHPEEATERGARGRDFVARHFSWDESVARYRQALLSLAQGTTGRAARAVEQSLR